MFRRKASGLPKDPVYPAHLDKLGFFITENDHIKNKEYPTDYMRFFITDNDRYNDVHREAMHVCMREEVIKRLEELDVVPLYLPQFTSTKPEHEPHLPILSTTPDELRKKSRVIIVVNRTFEDLAIWSYRVLAKEGGVDQGSSCAFVREINSRSKKAGNETPGIILLNPGQLLFSHRFNTAMTPTSWDAKPRPSAVHPPARIDPVHNHVKGNRDAEEHISFVFENMVNNEDYVNKDAKLYAVGLADGGDELSMYLDANWQKFSNRFIALALTAPLYFQPTDPFFVSFLARRARAWSLSHHELNTPLAAVDQLHLCPTLSGGESLNNECIMPAAYKVILDWFEQVERRGESYANEELVIPEVVLKELEADSEEQSEW